VRGGLRHLLAARAVPTSLTELNTNVAVSLRPAGVTGGNRAGNVLVPPPVRECDVRRLGLIVAATARPEPDSSRRAVMSFLVALAATQLSRSYLARQRASNVLVPGRP
jgi:hypothetical protein